MIEIHNLHKSFDGNEILKGIDIHVEKGSIYGLIGTNGSGKTTIIKHLTGIYEADSGEIRINGEDVFDNDKVKEHVGFVPDDLYFFNTYTIDNMAAFWKRLYQSWDDDRYQKMIASFELPKNRKISKFSKGMQKQAAFALVMSTCPDILILDEPVDGLDPIMRKKVWKYILDDVAERQMTVLISSHNLRELEGLIDTVGIMDHGKIILERGNLDELESEGGLGSLEELFFKEVGGDEA